MQPTTEREFLKGIVIDGKMAVDDRPSQGRETGKAQNDAGENPSENSPSHLAAAPLRPKEIFAYEGGTGGPVSPGGVAPNTVSMGAHSLLYLRIAFADSRVEPQTEPAACEMLRQANEWFVDSSSGNLYLLPAVAPLIVVPRAEAWYKTQGSELDLRDDALAAAAKGGYDGAAYDHVIFAYLGGPGNFQGLATIAGKYVWIRQMSVSTVVHELGHNLGLWHANSWDTGGVSVTGTGVNNEYGNIFDWMGGSQSIAGDFNAAWKSRLGWLPADVVHDIHQSGTFRLFASDQPRSGRDRRYALRIRKDSERYYWGEFRQRFYGANPSLASGILLNWSPWSQSGSGTQLLDTTPGSPGGQYDAPLTIGRTFSDLESGIHITPVGKGGGSPESIDVVVNLGAFPENHSPTAAVNAAQTTVAPGAVVQFMAAAEDADSDALAYSWDFGDGTFSTSNAAAVSKAWTGSGRFAVRCLVSDMKGGTASDSVVISVGSAQPLSITGYVTVAGQPLQNVRVHNGQTGANYRGAMTNSDGSYRLTGITPGTTSLSAVLPGYVVTPGFTNPLQIGADFNGASFTAEEMKKVSISVTDQFSTEGDDSAAVRISRTGPTDSPLKVVLAGRQGPIRIEYVMTPETVFDSALRGNVFQIPAGKSSIDVLIAALVDEFHEAPEILTLSLGPAPNYAISGTGAASVTFLDAGAPLQEVSVEAIDADASESADGASFLISRVGATSEALTVDVSLSGKATEGIDYKSFGDSVVIPAGETSVRVPITPVNDAEIEGLEDVTLALSTNTKYLISGFLGQGTVFITDDDTPEVSVVATGSTASEAGRNPATFVVSRTGGTAQPLTVNYAIAGSAVHGVDYGILPGVLTIPAGSSAASISVVPIDDDIGESPQTVVVRLAAGAAYAVGSAGSAAATIEDDDLPVVTIGVTDGTFAEPGDTGQFKITTTGSGTGNVNVRYSVSGSAISGTDFTALTGILTMARNATASVTITPLDDTLPEERETVTLTIEDDPSYSVFLDRSATINLLDNEHNIVNVSAGTGFLQESDFGQIGFYLSRQGSTAASLTVKYAMGGTAANGVDYRTLTGSAVIPAGQTGVSVTTGILSDSILEGAETATLTLLPNAAYGVGIPSATVIIPDDEVPAVTIGFGSAESGTTEGNRDITIPVVLSKASNETVTVEYLIAGGTGTGGLDFVPADGVLTFEPGEMEKSVRLTIIDDQFDEPAQTVAVQLKNAFRAALGIAAHTVVIADDDNSPEVTIGFASPVSSAGEDGQVLLPVSLTSAQPVRVTVEYSATGGTATGNGVDYTLVPGVLVFAPGETLRSIPLAVQPDSVNDANETVIVSLKNPSNAALNANGTHVFTIAPPSGTLAITPESPFTAEGLPSGPFAPSATVYTLRNVGDTEIAWTSTVTAGWLTRSPAGGSLMPGQSIDVTVSINSQSAPAAPGHYTASVSFSNTTNGQGSALRSVNLDVRLPVPAVEPEPLYSGGTENTISWSSLAAAVAYEVQRSPSSDFGNSVSSGWIAATQFRFTGLTDGSLQHYRVRARFGGASSAEGPWCSALFSTQDASPPVITFTGGELPLVSRQAVFLVSGTLADAGSGVSGLTVNGLPAALTNGGADWSAVIGPLSPGENLIRAEAVDDAQPGNRSSVVRSVYYATDDLDLDRDGLPDGWEHSNGLDLFDDGAIDPRNGPLGDGDLDGLGNLLEFVLNRDPNLPDAASPFALAVEQRESGDIFLTISYDIRADLPGLAAEVQLSDDMNEWQVRPENLEPVSVIANPGGVTERVTVRLLPAISDPATPRRFLRLHAAAVSNP
ncbi:MAG TPA: Calx-beta domain-containing protein [Verrucomicrobiales bacterium]|nr:Calx-beta domain-containing protein [Verrucomicrobiales bacterium]